MGAGNVYPHGFVDYEMVYVDSLNACNIGEDTEKQISDYWEWVADLYAKISDILPGSFEKVDVAMGTHTILAENNLLQVIAIDNQSSRAIAVVMPDVGKNLLPLAAYHMPRVAKKLFSGLKQAGYKLRVRTGPWTSGPYEE